MLELLGFPMFAAAVAIFTTVTPWLREQPPGGWIDRWMLAELVAIAIVIFGTFGLALIIGAMVEARSAGNLGMLAANLAGVAAVISAGVLIWRRTAGRAALPTA